MAIVFGAMVPHPPLIVSEVGQGEEKGAVTTINAYKKAMKRLLATNPDTIIITTPHSVMYSDYFHISPGRKASGSFFRFGAPQVNFDVEYDSDFVTELSIDAENIGFPAGTIGERDPSLDHGTTVPLYFLEKVLGAKLPCPIVRIGLSGLSFADHYRFGMLIKNVAEKLERNIAFISSGDLSHKLTDDGPYGFVKEGPQYDQKIMDIMSRAAFDELLDFPVDLAETAAECGHRSFLIMAGAMDKTAVKPEKLSYQGDFGVGYGICSYEILEQDDSRNFLEKHDNITRDKIKELRADESEQVKLARKTIEEYVENKRRIDIPQNISERLIAERAGVFVTLKKEGQLRGCIGTITPQQINTAQEIIENAISSATQDTRFSPVEMDELNELVYSVDVLGVPEDVSSIHELDTERYGVIVSKGARRGLLLPNLQGVSSVDEQLSIALQKAGIHQDDNYSIQRFEVIRYN